jgi:hypothetical protein
MHIFLLKKLTHRWETVSAWKNTDGPKSPQKAQRRLVDTQLKLVWTEFSAALAYTSGKDKTYFPNLPTLAYRPRDVKELVHTGIKKRQTYP